MLELNSTEFSGVYKSHMKKMVVVIHCFENKRKVETFYIYLARQKEI
jgi:phage-related protein